MILMLRQDIRVILLGPLLNKARVIIKHTVFNINGRSITFFLVTPEKHRTLFNVIYNFLAVCRLCSMPRTDCNVVGV